MQTVKLNNDIELFYKQNKDTPRIALCFNFSMNKEPKKAGVQSLMTRLLMQGTKNYTAEELAAELDKYAIEFSAEIKLDYLKLKFLCLNEDFEKAVEILEDIIKNTTFKDLEKEKLKLKGEIEADMDSPKTKVVDNYYKTLYANHHYGYTNSVVYENIDSITNDEILEAYHEFMTNSKKVIAVVGDAEFNKIRKLLNDKFGNFYKSDENNAAIQAPELEEAKHIEIIKPDAKQAHIIQGWYADTSQSEDYPALSLLNIILGASGLSSRLFLELRDKKGLAYVVRSSYDIAKLCANFSIYIATEPKNIEISLNGFKEEIEKIKTNPVSEEELNNAKNNLFGKWAYSMEDNNRQASTYAHYGVNGLGYDFIDKAKERIKKVTPEQIQTAANKYFNDKYVISIIKP